MGLIRKLISGSAAAATGGASLGVVQFRSDTERGTRQTKLLRRELERQDTDLATPSSAGRSTEALASPATSSQGAWGSSSSDSLTIVELLERLAGLHSAGVLSDEEFAEQKARALARLGE